MKLTKAALVKLIKEEMADIQERVTPETIAMKGRLDEISQILETFSGASFEIGQVYRQIKELMEAELAPENDPSGGPLGAMDPSAPSHAGVSVTDPNTGQRMYAKSGPKGNK